MSNVLHLNDSTLSSVIQDSGNTPVMVAFKATWCGPCKALAPLLEQIAAENTDKVKVVFVDVDESQKSALQFAVRAVPTTVVFKNGHEVAKVVGLVSKAKLLNAIQ